MKRSVFLTALLTRVWTRRAIKYPINKTTRAKINLGKNAIRISLISKNRLPRSSNHCLKFIYVLLIVEETLKNEVLTHFVIYNKNY
jgi:hypothetical protein